MAKYVALLSFICLLLSCSNMNSKPDYASLIKGDWRGHKTSEGFEHNQTEFLSFEDSMCHAPLMHEVIKYEILQDTLYLTSLKENEKGPRNKFTIVKLDADSLVLLSGKKQHDTIRYWKIHTKNDITPAIINFASSGCFGTCPVMNVLIDSSRNIHFYGNRHTSLTGGFSGKLNESEYNSILLSIRNLPLDSLSETYEAPWTDDQAKGVAIVYGNKVTRSVAYGHHQEPVELYLLFIKLMQLYKHVNLKPDSSVNDSYFINSPNIKPEWFPFPPPPPPPPITPEMREFTPPNS